MSSLTRPGHPEVHPVTTKPNPAQFSDTIIDALTTWIPRVLPIGHHVHDPFAGAGTKLGQLCDDLGVIFTGTDLERWKDGDDRVQVGDSTCAATYPDHPFVVCTSPTYNNGCNDHFTPTDISKRLTYRIAAGHALHMNNTGRWSGRRSQRGEDMYWEITNRVVANWPDIALVNVKNSYRRHELYDFIGLWTTLLLARGYQVKNVEVSTPGWRVGTNNQARTPTETILIATRHG